MFKGSSDPKMGLVFWFLVFLINHSFVYSKASSNSSVIMRPSVVNVGAIFPFNSTIGKVAKVAMLAALDDVNSDPGGGIKLNITMKDSGYSGFLGIVEGICLTLIFLHLFVFLPSLI